MGRRGVLFFACVAATRAVRDEGYGHAGQNTKDHAAQSDSEGERQGPVVWLGLGLGLRERSELRLTSRDLLDPAELPGSHGRPVDPAELREADLRQHHSTDYEPSSRDEPARRRALGDRRRLGKKDPRGTCGGGCKASLCKGGKWGVCNGKSEYMGTVVQVCPYGCACQHKTGTEAHCHLNEAAHFAGKPSNGYGNKSCKSEGDWAQCGWKSFLVWRWGGIIWDNSKTISGLF